MIKSNTIFFILVLLNLLFEALAHLAEQNAAEKKPVLKYGIFTEQCYTQFFVNFNLTNFDCLKYSITKLLGYCVVVGASIVKLPQIIKIIIKKSIFGISFSSICFEVMTQLMGVAYHRYKNNPFSVYGQTLLISLQMVIIISLFLIYDSQKKLMYLIALLLTSIVFYIAMNPTLVPIIVLFYFVKFKSNIVSAARLSQIFAIHRNKSTGSLSIITCGLTVLGNLARLTTAFVEVSHDYKYGISVFNACAMNIYILVCFFIFDEKKQQKNQKPLTDEKQRLLSKEQ